MRARLLSFSARTEPLPLPLGLLFAAVLIGAETLALFPLHGTAHQDSRGVVYLVGVLIVSAVCGAALGVLTALASAVAYNYFHVPPFGTFDFSAGEDLQDVAVFLVAAVLVSGLANLARKHAAEISDRRQEADLGADLAHVLLGTDDLYPALDTAAQRIARTFQIPWAAIELDMRTSDGRRAAFPLYSGMTALGTLLLPADLPEPTLQRLRERIVPTLAAVLCAARERESSREQSTLLAEQQAALRRVATLVAHGAAPAEVFDAVAEEIGRVLGPYSTALYRYELNGTVTRVAGTKDLNLAEQSFPVQGESLFPIVLRTGAAARIASYEHATGPNAEIARREGYRSGVGVPLVVEGRIWGLAVVVTTRPEPLPANTETRMADFTELIATAIANAETHAELTASRARIVAASDEARRRIERDLHDGAQQRLVALGLQMRVVEEALPAGLDSVRHDLSQVVDDLTGVLHDLQELSRGIHPAILSKGGLGPAVKALARRSPTPVDLTLAVDRRLPEPVEVGAYYVVSEALTNTAKHANASLVRINLEAGDTCLRISVRDNGIGGASTDSGSGLIGLRDRVATLGGRLDIVSPTGHGTALLVEIPIDSD
ncbi:hypothetical protein GCM10010399_07890 [Dactylosporangium fulvum]|uniref:histidine kinase n=1 Tax=Dactylosporangium fulvum TaxID=53359 RepID=A0ABY5WBS3_9ACTN|nr:DUF4118 domain-containing protein [Dactylosporangium fulvum]UWP86566.1 DUF4118 domain-containing protein [Dactylosporangium fulvum]